MRTKIDPAIQNQADFMHRMIYRIVYEVVGNLITDDGKLALGTAAVQGQLRKGGGGTGNTWGFADHSHAGGNQGQRLAEANTHQSLNVDPATAIHWSREMLQDMMASFLVDQDGNPFSYNDAGNLLTIASTSTLADLTDTEIVDLQEGDMLVYIDGKWRNVHGLTDPDAIYWSGESMGWGGEPLEWG